MNYNKNKSTANEEIGKMTKTIIEPTSKDHKNLSEDVSITELLRKIQATPREYWSKLLPMLRLFRETATFNQSEVSQVTLDPSETNLLTAQYHALKELTQQWIEEGDEKEQTETLEYLQHNLD
jgi:hypothetical protein